MKLIPLADRVVLKQVEAEEMAKSGIVLPGSAQEKPQTAEVIAVGPGGLDKDAQQALDSLGSVLGRYDLKTQLDAAGTCLRTLRQRQEKLQQSLPQSRRLIFGVALSAAMLLGIILI